MRMRGVKGPDWSPTHNQIIPVTEGEYDWDADAKEWVMPNEPGYDWEDDARKCYLVALAWMRAQLKPDLCICGQPKKDPIPEGSHYVTPCCRQTVSNCCGDVL
jgi:hypothetical protein